MIFKLILLDANLQHSIKIFLSVFNFQSSLLSVSVTREHVSRGNLVPWPWGPFWVLKPLWTTYTLFCSWDELPPPPALVVIQLHGNHNASEEVLLSNVTRTKHLQVNNTWNNNDDINFYFYKQWLKAKAYPVKHWFLVRLYQLSVSAGKLPSSFNMTLMTQY